jgi:hypothetical protein
MLPGARFWAKVQPFSSKGLMGVASLRENPLLATKKTQVLELWLVVQELITRSETNGA